MKKLANILWTLMFLWSASRVAFAQERKTPPADTAKISFTFDDGITTDLAGFQFEKWNRMILTALEEAGLKAVFFVTGSNKLDEKGALLLSSWDEKGHRIGNHTFTHPNFNSEKNSVSLFERELLKTNAVIAKYNHHIKLFRFPYLKEGGGEPKVKRIREILEKNHYSNGYVTIDCSDWFVNSRLVNSIKKKGFENTDVDRYKDFYLKHVLERANYYEKLSYELNHRHIHHTLLLHHNLTSALFLGDLIQKLKEEGWMLVDADEAYEDRIFQIPPSPEFAGESLIWSLAKQSGKYEGSLRYPAEDSRYEAPEMDKLGL